jgi:hypothetical protein
MRSTISNCQTINIDPRQATMGNRLIFLALDEQPTRNLEAHNAPIEPNVGYGK